MTPFGPHAEAPHTTSHAGAHEGASIHVGASFWLCDEGRTPTGPARSSSVDSLRRYVTQFDTVEVSASFHALPRAATLFDWVTSAPPGFTFALHALRSLTHEKRLRDVAAATRAFVDVAASMGEAAGPVLIRLPPELDRMHHGRELATWLEWLAAHRRGLRVAVEPRATDLMTPAFAAYLARFGFALTLGNCTGAPDLFEAWTEVIGAGAGPGFASIRLAGVDGAAPRGDAGAQCPRDVELERWAGRIRAISAAGQEVFCYVHPMRGERSHADASRLRALLGSAASAWPVQPGQAALL